jgi:PadR family transcriptional regulator PadR
LHRAQKTFLEFRNLNAVASGDPDTALLGPFDPAGLTAPRWESIMFPVLGMGREYVTQPMVLLQGTLDVLVLRTLAWGSMHGYAVSRSIRDRTGGVLEIEDAPLYKALHRLERAGFVSAEWGLSENNRRARYYSLTPAGRRQLKAEESAWRRYADAVFKVLEPT